MEWSFFFSFYLDFDEIHFESCTCLLERIRIFCIRVFIRLYVAVVYEESNEYEVDKCVFMYGLDRLISMVSSRIFLRVILSDVLSLFQLNIL